MRKVLSTMCFIFNILTSVTLFISISDDKNSIRAQRKNMIVQLNEIEQLSKLSASDKSSEKKLHESISKMQDELRTMEGNNSIGINSMIKMYGVCLIFLLCILVYIYYEVLRPFRKLKKFAADIAKGDFDSPLYVERNNLFGDFTWSFDMMRKEVKKARRCEKEAVENNKTAIATISHDIKTPVASIRAYTEALQSNMDTNYERKQRYLSVILKKCDEVTELTNDLFLHSLSDLEKLEIKCEKLDASETINSIVSSLVSDKSKAVIHNEIPHCVISADSKRLGQVFENIIANSIKYADNKAIELCFDFSDDDKYLQCTIKDHGPGILDEDMPFIFNKFYRGHNVKQKPGAGLGLYIVKYIMEQMDGNVRLSNYDDGLKTVLNIPIVYIDN